MGLVVGVRFADAGKLYYYDPDGIELKIGDSVVAETARGMELGEVVLGPREVADTETSRSLRKISKRADERDYKKLEHNVQREEEAFKVCADRIKKRHLPMKLIDVEYTFDGSKLIFYFAAEGRVDFRELVKDLASVFRTRIELRQIGVRDETKKIGGLGPCGRPACCNEFLEEFTPVSIKMAKEQNLSLSPTKISGLCGRLMCCLHYEHEHYRETLRKLPRVGAVVETPDGPAEVVATDPLGGRIDGRIELEDGSPEVRKFSIEDLGQTLERAPVRTDDRSEPAQRHNGPADSAEHTHQAHVPRRIRQKPANNRRGDDNAGEKKTVRARAARHDNERKPAAGGRTRPEGQQRHAEKHKRQRRSRDDRAEKPSVPRT